MSLGVGSAHIICTRRLAEEHGVKPFCRCKKCREKEEKNEGDNNENSRNE